MATIYGIEGLLAGRTLVNRYRIEEVIGRGGMGAVYRARDTHLNREVAVKVISATAPDLAAHERLRDRFRREARAAAGLQHPCVVAVHDYGTDPELGLDFLVMQLLTGEDLANRLQRVGSPDLRTALSILQQAGRGLAAGHRVGIIHRDVKPGNIFLETGDRAGEVRVKVLDFGIADMAASGEDTLTHLTVAGRSPFSPAFASPEQLRGAPTLTPATDVFSLAAIGFQLLTGRRLFSSSDPQQMVVEMMATLAEERPALAALPGDLGALLRKALSPDPRERPEHAGVFADALEQVHAQMTGLEPPSRPMPATRESQMRESHRVQTSTRYATRPPRSGEEHQPQDLASTMLWEGADRSPSPVRHEAAPVASALAGSAPVAPAQEKRHGWLRRMATAALNLLITVAATAAYGAAWFAVFIGLDDANLDLVYGGVAASVVATPFAVHRLMGRRGWLGAAVLASLVATFACGYALGDSQPMELVVGATFAAQTLLCLLVERLTGRRTRAGAEAIE